MEGFVKIRNDMDKKEPDDKYGILVPDLPKRFNIGLLDGYCNLKCPMCHVHGRGHKQASPIIRGKMSYEHACRIFDEIMEVHPVINPVLSAEPLMLKDLAEYIKAMKNRGILVVMNTNGLLLTERIAKTFVEINLDSIFFSIDAVTKETLAKIRGIDKLEKIKDAVFMMLASRGDKQFPRIGVSFVYNKENEYERNEFIKYWLKHVDAVRVNEEFVLDECTSKEVAGIKRTPCGMLFDFMTITPNGDVPICCLDTANKYVIGNVFRDGVKNVWKSEKFEEIRGYHFNNEYEKIPICRNCKVWMRSSFEEIIVDDILIRRSPIMTFYNRMDRMATYQALRIKCNR